MKIKCFLTILTCAALVACGKPSAPETPNPEEYGKTIQPFHQIPADAQEGGGKARSIEEKSSY